MERPQDVKEYIDDALLVSSGDVAILSSVFCGSCLIPNSVNVAASFSEALALTRYMPVVTCIETFERLEHRMWLNSENCSQTEEWLTVTFFS